VRFRFFRLGRGKAQHGIALHHMFAGAMVSLVFRPCGRSGKFDDNGHGRLLDAQGRELRRLQEETARTKADLQALTRRLEDLAGLSASLEPLVSRLNGIVNGK
jgi:hypothetical protein